MTNLNLDSMTTEELEDFMAEYREDHVALSHKLFPGRLSSAVAATDILAAYAACKKIAMALRQKGEIERARVYENDCNDIYDRLPAFARLW